MPKVRVSRDQISCKAQKIAQTLRDERVHLERAEIRNYKHQRKSTEEACLTLLSPTGNQIPGHRKIKTLEVAGVSKGQK